VADAGTVNAQGLAAATTTVLGRASPRDVA
jgi:hypothetical protein